MPNSKYTIKRVATGEVLAENLGEPEVEAWWKANEQEYFGVRVEGNDIIVEKHQLVGEEAAAASGGTQQE